MKVRLTAPAEADLDRILSSLEGVSPAGASSVASSIRRALQFLSEHPHGGIRTRRPEVFVKIVAAHPYKLFYQIGAEAVEILHIRHAARRPWIR